jgi:hypothetical protein
MMQGKTLMELLGIPEEKLRVKIQRRGSGKEWSYSGGVEGWADTEKQNRKQ